MKKRNLGSEDVPESSKGNEVKGARAWDRTNRCALLQVGCNLVQDGLVCKRRHNQQNDVSLGNAFCRVGCDDLH